MRSGAGLEELLVCVVPDAPSTPSVVHHRLDTMRGGWFVGDFSPAAMHCHGAEVAVKHVPAGGREPSHEHRIATEVTVVVAGTVVIAGHEWRAGDVVVVPPRTPAGFEALTDAMLVVVKSPSLVGDKYAVPERPVVVVDGQVAGDDVCLRPAGQATLDECRAG